MFLPGPRLRRFRGEYGWYSGTVSSTMESSIRKVASRVDYVHHCPTGRQCLWSLGTHFTLS